MSFASVKMKLFACMLGLVSAGFVGESRDASQSEAFFGIARRIERRQSRRHARQEARAERWGHGSSCSGESSSCSGKAASCSGEASCSGASSCSGGYSYLPAAVSTEAPCPTCTTVASIAEPASSPATCPCDCENCTCPKAEASAPAPPALSMPAAEAPAPPMTLRRPRTQYKPQPNQTVLTGYLRAPELLTGNLTGHTPILLASSQ